MGKKNKKHEKGGRGMQTSINQHYQRTQQIGNFVKPILSDSVPRPSDGDIRGFFQFIFFNKCEVLTLEVLSGKTFGKFWSSPHAWGPPMCMRLWRGLDARKIIVYS